MFELVLEYPLLHCIEVGKTLKTRAEPLTNLAGLHTSNTTCELNHICLLLIITLQTPNIGAFEPNLRILEVCKFTLTIDQFIYLDINLTKIPFYLQASSKRGWTIFRIHYLSTESTSQILLQQNINSSYHED